MLVGVGHLVDHCNKECFTDTPSNLPRPQVLVCRTLGVNFHMVMVALVEVLDSLVGKQELAPSLVIQQGPVWAL